MIRGRRLCVWHSPQPAAAAAAAATKDACSTWVHFNTLRGGLFLSRACAHMWALALQTGAGKESRGPLHFGPRENTQFRQGITDPRRTWWVQGAGGFVVVGGGRLMKSRCALLRWCGAIFLRASRARGAWGCFVAVGSSRRRGRDIGFGRILGFRYLWWLAVEMVAQNYTGSCGYDFERIGTVNQKV